MPVSTMVCLPTYRRTRSRLRVRGGYMYATRQRGRQTRRSRQLQRMFRKILPVWHLLALTRLRPFLTQLIERWSPPPCDPLLEIPGELVFSLVRKRRTEYWAARVEQYLPPKTPSMVPKYRVRFKDDSLCTVSRDMFYTSDEPEFYTCNVSTSTSSIPIHWWFIIS